MDTTGFRVSGALPEDYLAFKAYARAHDPGWPEGEEYPNPELVSQIVFRRFRHDFTNYDELLTLCHGDREAFMRVCRSLCLVAHLMYPEISPTTFSRFLKKKARYLDRRPDRV